VKDTWFKRLHARPGRHGLVGFDQERPLGESEKAPRRRCRSGFTSCARRSRAFPSGSADADGLVTLRISPQSGALVSAENPDGVPEIFPGGPPAASGDQGSMAQSAEGQPAAEPIF